MKFSVLMSVYKNEKAEYLKQAVDSILSQTLMPNEIIIVKDGILTNELEQVINTYLSNYKNLIKIVSFCENRGLGLALRDGILACNNEYIARMDTDDIAEPDRFEQQFNYLKLHPELAILGSWIKEFSDNLKNSDTVTNLPCTHEEILNFAKKRNPFRHMTVILKKSAVIGSGNYRDFLWFEDYDLWVRMFNKGYIGANLPLYLVNVRAENSMFARRGGWKYLKQDLKFQKFLYSFEFITMAQFMQNVVMRSIVRLLPNVIRILIYKHLLRRKLLRGI